MQVIKCQKTKRIVEVPAGSYYLGDPCYVFGDDTDSWKQAGSTSNYFEATPVASVNGQHVLGFHTERGDGKYFDNFGHAFAVDAGLLGLVPEEMIEDGSTFRRLGLGIIVKFDEPTVCSTDRGFMEFGRYHINTRW